MECFLHYSSSKVLQWLLLPFVLMGFSVRSEAQNVPYQPAFTDADMSAPINLGLPVGVVEGSHATSGSGGLTYQIPIKLPPGTNGMVPALSISYSSQSGSGICGMGWSIAGASVIYRTGRDYWHDGTVSAPEISNNDAFSLDGSRLTPVSGSNGGNNTTYAMESENYSVITSYNIQGNGPEYFTVWMKDGSMWEYGRTSDSRMLAGTGAEVICWKLNKITNPSGNYIVFSYRVLDGEHLLSEVWYTGNAAAGMQPYNHANFEYATRADKNTTYEAGRSFTISHLLTAVKVYTDASQPVRTYNLSYCMDELKLYSLLREVTECGADNHCFNPTQFKYGDETVSSVPVSVNPTPGQEGIVGNANHDLIVGDYNGDGYSDVVEFWQHLEQSTNLMLTDSFVVKLKDPTNNSFHISYSYKLQGNYWIVGEQLKMPNNYSLHVADYDGDGADDILLVFRKQAGTLAIDKINIFTKLYQQAPVVTVYAPPSGYDKVGYQLNYIFSGDFDGDGRSDYIISASNGVTYKTFITCPAKGYINEPVLFSSTDFSNYYYLPDALGNSHNTAVVDFDGDGRSDLFFVREEHSNWPVSESIVVSCSRDGSGNWTAGKRYQSGYPSQWHTILFGDFNGDRKTDLLTRVNGGTNQWEMALSDGKQYRAENFSFSTVPNVYKQANHYLHDLGDDLLLIADYNGDGKSDILFGKDQSNAAACDYTLYYSKGNRDMVTMPFYHKKNHGRWYCLGDFTGDGKFDLLSFEPATLPHDLFAFYSGVPDRLLNKIRDGFGNITTATHRTLTDRNSNNYIFTGFTPYPLTTVNAAIWCVRDIAVPDGIGGLRNTGYYYSDAWIHRGGKGMLGFRTLSSYDFTSGNVTENTVSLNNTSYLPEKMTTNISNSGTGLSRSTAEYLITDLGSKRYKQEVASTYSEDLLAGTWSSTHTSYDSYSNPVTVATNNFNLETATQENQYAMGSATGNPVPYKVIHTTTSSQRQGAAQITGQTGYSYYPNGTLRSKVSFQSLPGQIVTDYTYDAMGNLTRESSSSSGVPTKTAGYQYDALGRFVVTKTDAKGGQEHTSYDDRWGTPVQFVGIDRLTSYFDYDEFGRNTETTLPNGTRNTHTQRWYVDPACNGLYEVELHTPGHGMVVTQMDALSRPVKTRTAARQNAVQLPGMPPFVLTEETISERNYDTKGNLLSESEPHFRSESDFLTKTYSYDWLGRMMNSCDALHGCTRYSYSYSGGQLTTTTTNPVGVQSSATVDATGKVVRTADAGGYVLFEYNSRGLQTRSVPNNSQAAAVATTYDDYGHKKELKDPDAGTLTYSYNAWDQLISETDANGNTHTMDYDITGQLLSRTGPEGAVHYVYLNAAASGQGYKVDRIIDFNNATTTFQYDLLGRVINRQEVIGSRNFNTSFNYDQYDRVTRTTHADAAGGSIVVDNAYDDLGLLKTVRCNNTVLYEQQDVNGKGQITQYVRNKGNLPSSNKYQNGYLLQKYTAGYQDYNMAYNYVTGNPVWRSDGMKNVDEQFDYDQMDRLTNAWTTYLSGGSYNLGTPQGITYQGVAASDGNIASKTDVGDYKYATRPHAVNYVNNAGGLIPATPQDIVYTPFLKVGIIEEDQWQLRYQYGYDYERRLSELYQAGTLTEQRYYTGTGHELHRDALTGAEKDIVYIQGGDGICAVLEKTAGATQFYFPFEDHLGSIQSLVDDNGTVVYEQSFDAWGRYRDVGNWQPQSPYYTPPAAFSWVRGFTGHEHLPQFGLINMNGRMYDPLLGRMLSPDKYIQSPGYSQSYNRYSYCWNNPMRYTDPSGDIVGASFFACAYLAELGSNLIYGESRPFAKAFNSAQNASSLVSNSCQIPVYQNGYTTVTMGLDVFGFGISANYYYHDGDFDAHAGIGLGLMGGPSANAGISERLHLGNAGTITLGATAGTNFSTYSVSANGGYSYGGYSVNYGYSYHGGAESDGYGRQFTGTFGFSINDFHASHQNDFLAFGNTSDKYRTAAIDIGVGAFSFGSTIVTNDPLKEPGTQGSLNYRYEGEDNLISSAIYGLNKGHPLDKTKPRYTSWGEYGKVFFSDLYVQYRYGSQVSRTGYSAPFVQDAIQNGMHTSPFTPGNQNYYLNYSQFQSGAALYGGFINGLYTK